ncbi:MAG: ParB N-terminal domain-containing protein, partial [Kiloniellales bacterium]|nr:ParB N-terminal domain-containing protein [Kiloniellales bacterium]
MAGHSMFAGMAVSGEVLELDTTKVLRYKDQPRTHFDRVELEALKSSIKTLGQIDPVHVEELNGNGPRGKTHELIDGERRFQACSELDIPVRALVCKPRSRDLKFLHAVAANFNRAAHTPMEITRALRRIRAMPFIKKLKEGDQMRALGEFFGKSELWAWQYWGLDRLDEDLKEVVESREMPVTVAISLSSLPKPLQKKCWSEISDRNLKTNAAKRLVAKTILEEGLDENRRGRRPSDDWDLFKAYVNRIEQGMEPFLELQASDQFGVILRSRNPVELKAQGDNLDGLIERL